MTPPYGVPGEPRYLPPRYDTKQDDPLALLASNKRELLRSRIDMLLSQLEERKAIHKDVLEAIVQDDLACGTQAAQLEARHDHGAAQDIRLNQVLGLQRERRREMTSYFRDTGTLRDKLVEAVLDYKAAVQRESLVDKLEKQ